MKRPIISERSFCIGQTAFRGITLLQNDTDTMAARFWQIGLDYAVLEHRPIRVASVADYRK